MKQKIESKESLLELASLKPADYPICLNWQKCDKCKQCLHALETTEAKCQSPVIHCVNPSEYAEGHTCTQFRDKDARQYMAAGFMQQSQILKNQGKYREFKLLCMRHICRTVFYEMKNGSHLIYPADQHIIIDAAAQIGYHFPANGFDLMVEVQMW